MARPQSSQVILDRIVALRNAGLSIREVARQTGVSESVIRYYYKTRKIIDNKGKLEINLKPITKSKIKQELVINRIKPLEVLSKAMAKDTKLADYLTPPNDVSIDNEDLEQQEQQTEQPSPPIYQPVPRSLDLNKLRNGLISVINNSFGLTLRTQDLLHKQKYDEAKKLSMVIQRLKITVPDVIAMMSDYVDCGKLVNIQADEIENQLPAVQIKLVE
jgi:hypothetical protein